MKRRVIYWLLTGLLFSEALFAQQATLVNVAKGWAGNSINTVVFRKNSLASFKNYQFVSYYDSSGFVVIGKRRHGQQRWELKRTKYRGKVSDAHNSISLIVDGDGYLHLAWDHHNSILRYCRSVSPLSLELTDEMPMTGMEETNVSYPEFYTQPTGDLLFFYRDGGSGNGNLVINGYNRKEKKWKRIQTNLVDGEGKRNAYWQAYVDGKGVIYLSWVWRETPDVASNHDLCFARSEDGGITWERSTGEKYVLPLNAGNAEYACIIPQKSELINQTSMHADEKGNAVIAGYWREKGNTIPQYHIVYHTGKQWQTLSLDFRKTPFSLSGVGSKKIPVARPQLVVNNNRKRTTAWLFFRDEERGNKVSVVTITDLEKGTYTVTDLSSGDLGNWEPSYDTELWKQQKRINLFVQRTVQADAEGLTNTPPQMVQVLEWKPKR